MIHCFGNGHAHCNATRGESAPREAHNYNFISGLVINRDKIIRFPNILLLLVRHHSNQWHDEAYLGYSRTKCAAGNGVSNIPGCAKTSMIVHDLAFAIEALCCQGAIYASNIRRNL